MSRRKLILAVAGTAVALLGFFLGDRIPLLSFLNVPGFFISFLLFSRGHEYGTAFLAGGLIFNSVFYSGLFLAIAEILAARHPAKLPNPACKDNQSL